jgi:hypothetical protein
MEIAPYLGIGDILIWKIYSYYENIDIKQIIISLDNIYIYRTHPTEYLDFIQYLINKLFMNVPIKYMENAECKYPNFTRKITNPLIYNLISFNTIYTIPYSNYIIFHTKLRIPEEGLEYFINNYKKIYDYIKILKTKKTILLLGERTIDTNIETYIHNIKSIYPLLLELKAHNNVIDLTKETIHNANTIEDFEKDSQLIHNAECNITMGYGGNFVLSTAIAKYTIAYTPFCDSYYIDVLDSNTIKNTKTIEHFCNEISKII